MQVYFEQGLGRKHKLAKKAHLKSFSLLINSLFSINFSTVKQAKTSQSNEKDLLRSQSDTILAKELYFSC